MKAKQIGIYLIKSPSSRIYVGQSRDISSRFATYFKLHCKSQPILYRSLIKYGVDAHEFSVLELCEFDELNIRERFWQEYYDVLGDNGLNCVLQNTEDKPQVFSEETMSKMRDAQTSYRQPVTPIDRVTLSLVNVLQIKEDGKMDINGTEFMMYAVLTGECMANNNETGITIRVLMKRLGLGRTATSNTRRGLINKGYIKATFKNSWVFSITQKGAA